MKVELFYQEDKKYQTLTESGVRLDIDMKPLPEKKHQAPMELLLSALISCAAVDLVNMIKKRRKNFVDLKGEVKGERRSEHPKGFTDIHIHYQIYSADLTPSEAAKFVEMACTKYCSVAASIGAKQTHSFEIIRPSSS